MRQGQVHKLHEVRLPVLLSARSPTPHHEQTPQRTKGQAMSQYKDGYVMEAVVAWKLYN